MPRRHQGGATVATPNPVITPYTMTFDYTRPLLDVCSDCQLDWCDTNFIEKNFRVVGEGIVEEEVFTIHLKRDLTDGAALAIIDRLGYELVGNTEGVQFATKHKDMQRLYTLVFGSACRDPNRVLRRPCFPKDNTGQRGIGLGWIGPREVWHDDFRFLVRRKRKSAHR